MYYRGIHITIRSTAHFYIELRPYKFSLLNLNSLNGLSNSTAKL